MLHLVRNAVSHGIEPPDDRVAKGKRPEGTITLSASAAGEQVTIEIADDGGGVDAAEVVPVPVGPDWQCPLGRSTRPPSCRCCVPQASRPKTMPTERAGGA